MPSKKCSKCGEEKPFSEFSKDRSKKDGLQYPCKACNQEYQRKYREANPEKAAESSRKYREAHPERVAERKRKYYQRNSEAIKEAARQWQRNNPDKDAARKNRRRARKANVPSDGIPVDITDQPCYVCGAPAEAVDHVVPLSKGGHDTVDNKRPICHSCNSAKRDYTWPGQPDWPEFLERRRNK